MSDFSQLHNLQALAPPEKKIIDKMLQSINQKMRSGEYNKMFEVASKKKNSKDHKKDKKAKKRKTSNKDEEEKKPHKSHKKAKDGDTRQHRKKEKIKKQKTHDFEVMEKIECDKVDAGEKKESALGGNS